MTATKKLTALVAVLLSLFVLMSLCTVSVFAEESTEETTEETTAETVEETGDSDSESDSESESASETSSDSETGSESASATDSATESASDTTEDKKEKTTRGLINLGVGALILIVLAILAIKFRAKIPGWWKALKSECGKISWCSKDKLKKNTIVVVIIILIITVAIAILDFAFSEGLGLLGKIFG